MSHLANLFYLFALVRDFVRSSLIIHELQHWITISKSSLECALGIMFFSTWRLLHFDEILLQRGLKTFFLFLLLEESRAIYFNLPTTWGRKKSVHKRREKRVFVAMTTPLWVHPLSFGTEPGGEKKIDFVVRARFARMGEVYRLPTNLGSRFTGIKNSPAVFVIQ